MQGRDNEGAERMLIAVEQRMGKGKGRTRIDLEGNGYLSMWRAAVAQRDGGGRTLPAGDESLEPCSGAK